MRAPCVAIDLRIPDAAGAERSGLGRYSLELARGLPEARPDWSFVLHSNRPDLVQGGGPVVVRGTRWPTGSSAGRVSWLHLGSAAALRPRADVWFSPHPALPIWWRRPAVVTVHDLVPILMPERYRGAVNSGYARWMIRHAATRADRILCGSEETRARIVQQLGIGESRVSVTPYGVAERFFSIERAEPAAGGSFVLFVGTLEARKGVEVLHQALRAVNREGPRLRLVLAGNPGWRTEAAIEQLGADPNVEIVPGASDEQLARLYGEALALVFPSRMEGFGLPVAEAMAAGCPVISSDLACVREFAGDGPRYVPPGDAGELAAALEQLLADPAGPLRRAETARRQVAGLRWAAVAEATAVEIERALR